MNFQDLYNKIKSIDENVEVPAVVEPMPASDTLDASVEEHGMMMSPMGAMGAMAPNTPPPQQDTVSMNVSMNAQGAGGIRDLMNVLKDIQDGPDHDSADTLTGEPHHAEIDADPELDIAMPEPHNDEEEADVQVVHLGNDEDEVEKEAFVNEPDEQYQDQEYMNNTLSVNKQKMTKGGYRNSDNPLTMAAILPVAAMAGRMREGLQENIRSNLQAHYDKLKEAGFQQPNTPGSTPPARMNPAGARPGSGPKAIDPVSNNPVTMKPQTVAPQANRPGLATNGDPKLWDIQHELQKRGYKIKPDGLNGPATQKAAADAGMIDAIRQDVANPKAAAGGFDIGHAIGSGIGWIETAWRNLQTGLSRGRAGMEESADLDDIKKLSGLNY